MPEVFEQIRGHELRTIVYQLEQECVDLGTLENLNAALERDNI